MKTEARNLFSKLATTLPIVAVEDLSEGELHSRWMDWCSHTVIVELHGALFPPQLLFQALMVVVKHTMKFKQHNRKQPMPW